MNKDQDLSTLTNRLNYILQITGTRKADLARAIGVKPQIIQFLCTTQTKASRFTFELATALGLNTRWLATGEGTMFIADDSEQQFLREFKKIPLLTGESILNSLSENKSIIHSCAEGWLPLRTSNEAIFAIKITDTSMEPCFPNGAFVFIEENPDYSPKKKDFVFAYLQQFDIFVIREIVINNTNVFLTPKNTELFKEISFSVETKIIGAVTDCFWHIRS